MFNQVEGQPETVLQTRPQRRIEARPLSLAEVIYAG